MIYDKNSHLTFVSFIWKLKAAEFQNTLELYHDQIIWGRNYCVNLDNAVLMPPKNVLFSLFIDVKPFLPWKKKSTIPNDLHHWKGMTETMFLPCFGESTYFDFGARLFSTQWPLYVAHILQGLLCRKRINWYRCFYPHRSWDSVSPVCRI